LKLDIRGERVLAGVQLKLDIRAGALSLRPLVCGWFVMCRAVLAGLCWLVVEVCWVRSDGCMSVYGWVLVGLMYAGDLVGVLMWLGLR